MSEKQKQPCIKLVNGPVISTELYAYRTDSLQESVKGRLKDELTRAESDFETWVAERLREAYMNGLGDGFAQGVASKHHAKQEGVAS